MLKGKEKGMSIGLFVFTICAIVLYSVSNLILYIFSFAYEESLRLASYSRYVNTIFTMMGLIWIGHLCETLLSDVKLNYDRTLIFTRTVKATLVVLAVAISFLGFFYFRVDTRKITNRYSEWMDAVKQCEDTDYIYYAATGEDTTEQYLIVRYIATPVRCNGWREGGSYAEGRAGYLFTGDPFSMDMTKEELVAALDGYDYFFVDNATDEFVSKYGALFDGEVKEKVLYRINRTDDGIVLVLK